MPCSGPRYLPALISLSAGRRLREREILGQRDDAVELIAVASSSRARYIFVRSVDVTLRLSISAASDGDRLEREILEIRGHVDARRPRDRSFALRRRPRRAAVLPGCRYGRNVIAGSVSSGTLSLRSSRSYRGCG